MTSLFGRVLGEEGGLYYNALPYESVIFSDITHMIVAPIFLFISVNNDVKNAYRDFGIRILELTGVIHLLRMVFTSESMRAKLVSATKRKHQVSVLSSANSSVNSSVNSSIAESEFEGDYNEEAEVNAAPEQSIRAKPGAGAAAFEVASVVDTYGIDMVQTLMKKKVTEAHTADERAYIPVSHGELEYRIPTAELLKMED